MDKQELANLITDEYTFYLWENRTYPVPMPSLIGKVHEYLGTKDAEEVKAAIIQARYELALQGVLVDFVYTTMPIYPKHHGHGDYVIAREVEQCVLAVFDYDWLRGYRKEVAEPETHVKQILELITTMLAPTLRSKYHMTVDRDGLYRLCWHADWAGIDARPFDYEEFSQALYDGWDYWFSLGVVASDYFNLYCVNPDRVAEVEAATTLIAARKRVPGL